LQPNDLGELTAKKARREFVVSEYFEDRDGRWRCEKPGSLPCGGEGEACRVWVHEWRERSSGPEFPLMVVYCRTHDRYFTVYPPGHVPYGRVAIGPEPGTGAGGHSAWRGTLFEAAVGEGWLRDYVYSGGTSWQTHRRRLVRCGVLLGLHGDGGVGESIAAMLDVPLHVHAAARRVFQRGDVSSQRTALRSALETVTVSPRLWRALTRAGHAAGLWGGGWEWARGGPLLSPFPAPEAEHSRASAEAPRSTRELTRSLPGEGPLQQM
jgi:hypothetical protein